MFRFIALFLVATTLHGRAAVETGIDVLKAQDFAPIAGKRPFSA